MMRRAHAAAGDRELVVVEQHRRRGHVHAEEAPGVAVGELHRRVQSQQIGGHEGGIGAGLDVEILERDAL